MPVSETDIELATIELNGARAMPQLQHAFKTLSDLFRQEPENPRVRQLMETLADKNDALIERVREVYSEFGMQFRPLNPVLEHLREQIQKAAYDENLPEVDRFYAEFIDRGGKDPDTDRRVANVRNKFQQPTRVKSSLEFEPATIPFEVIRLKNEANSTLNRGQYPRTIELANQALKILHDQNVSTSHPTFQDIEKTLKEAMNLGDAREQNAAGMELIHVGNWREAFNLYDRASQTFQLKYLDEQRDALREALKKEKELLEEARGLDSKIDIHSIERVLAIIEELKNLPGLINAGDGDAPPPAQAAMLRRLNEKLDRTKASFLQDAEFKLNLASRETDSANAYKTLNEARESVEFVKRFDETDEKVRTVLQRINAEDQQRRLDQTVDDQKRRIEVIRRSRLLSLLRIVVVVIVLGVIAGVALTAFNTLETNNANASATQLLLDGSRTAFAVTQANLNRESTSTQSAFFANLTQTKAVLDNQMTATALVLTQTQDSANQLASATQSSMLATSQERDLQLTLAMESTKVAGTAFAVTQTQAAANATATKFILDVTLTFVALPTATPTPPGYVCLGRTVYGVTLRISPSIEARSVDVIARGTEVQIYDYEGSNPGWFQVIDPAKSTGGWIFGDGVTVNTCPASLFDN